MKRAGWVALLTWCVAMGVSGCSRLEEVFMSAPSKINAAYPVSSEVRLAHERVTNLLSGDTQALAELQTVSDAQMTLRALNCSKGRVVERWDTVESLKQLSLDRSCFQAQDQELLSLYGLRSVGALLSQPPLKPRSPLGTKRMLSGDTLDSILQAVVATDANVAVLVDHQSQGVVFDLVESKTLVKLPRRGSIDHDGLHISPNGRVVAITTSGQSTVFVEAESGQVVWAPSDKGRLRMLAWLPEVSAWVMSSQDGPLMLADGVKGTLAPHPQAIKNTSLAVNIPGKPPTLLMGTSRDLVLVAHERGAEGIVARNVKQYSLAQQGVSSGPLIPMRTGQEVVYRAHPDLVRLDLESGDLTTWRTAPMFYTMPVKLDETRLLMDSGSIQSRPSWTWAFNVETQLVTQVGEGMRRGSIQPLGNRSGFFLRSSQSWLGDQVEPVGEGGAQTLSEVVADHELQIQLARAEAAGRIAEQENRVVIGNDRPDISRMGSAAPFSAAALPADAEVHMIGVHGGRHPQLRAGNMKQPVRVMVRPTARPVILVLASREPVNWLVIGTQARIAAVFLSGSEASGMGVGVGAPVMRIGSASAHEAGSSDYLRLRQAVTQHTGARPIKSFQGAHSGSDFTVGDTR